jgi:hypothetical protein
MTVHIDEMTTNVDVAAAASSPASDHSNDNGESVQRERARRAADKAARISLRTRSEEFDD